MAATIYVLCALTAFVCALLLLRSYRRTGHRLLLWSGISFGGLFLNNLILIADELVFPNVDLSTARLTLGLLALLPLLYGLIWEQE